MAHAAETKKRNIWPQTRINRHPAYRPLPTGEGALDLSFNWVNDTATRQGVIELSSKQGK